METSKMKNMVVLKNLPSNIVEEAIIILKSNTKKRNLQKIENNKNCVNTEQNKKYQRLKRYAIIATIANIIQLLIIIL